jgi:hypothetical protein
MAAPEGALDVKGLSASLAKELAEKVIAGREPWPQRPKRLLKNSWSAEQPPSAAKAVAENKPVIAAVNRCATQNQVQPRLFPQAVKRCPDTKPRFPAAC